MGGGGLKAREVPQAGLCFDQAPKPPPTQSRHTPVLEQGLCRSLGVTCCPVTRRSQGHEARCVCHCRPSSPTQAQASCRWCCRCCRCCCCRPQRDGWPPRAHTRQEPDGEGWLVAVWLCWCPWLCVCVPVPFGRVSRGCTRTASSKQPSLCCVALRWSRPRVHTLSRALPGAAAVASTGSTQWILFPPLLLLLLVCPGCVDSDGAAGQGHLQEPEEHQGRGGTGSR